MPPSLARLIAAGEVVQRPASALKELVENSLDAGATEITVHLERGGLGRLRVADNGSGIEEEDLPLVFVRHATSKLYDESQLTEILTLGFRGEALASIAEVARVRIQTRWAADEIGHEIEAAFGGVQPVRPVTRLPGTTVEVEQLFARVPARMQFLGSPAAETSRCLRVMQHAAIGNPHVRFEFVADGRVLLDAPRAETLEERIAQVYGGDFAETLMFVRAEQGTTCVEGFVSRPDACPRRNTRTVIFVNGRPVDVPRVRAAVRQVYRDRLVAGQNPEMILSIVIPPREIDPNVTPDKSTVRLRAEEVVAALAYRAVERASVPTVPEASPSEAPRPTARVAAASAPQPSFSRAITLFAPEEETPRTDAAQDGFFSDTTDPAPRPFPIAQLDRTLLFVPTESGVLYVDQHSLHERILYEELRRRSRDMDFQELLIPQTLRFSDSADQLRFEDLIEPLARVGFRIEPAGPHEYWIHATPAWSARQSPVRVLQEAVQALESDFRPCSSADELHDALLKRLACRAAVKAGEALSPAEIRGLWQKAAGLDLALLDVHGRPGALFVPYERIYRQLGRN